MRNSLIFILLIIIGQIITNVSFDKRLVVLEKSINDISLIENVEDKNKLKIIIDNLDKLIKKLQNESNN
jgi:hypothetical protein